MEVYFLDVGQGTAQVILHGNREATVIDCGPGRGSTLLKTLKRFTVDRLRCLIVSHTHNDHMGGAAAILGHYRQNIDLIGFIQDDEFLASVFWARVVDMLVKNELNEGQVLRLECTAKPQEIWVDAGKGTVLRTFSPSAVANLTAQAAGTANATSAVLVLTTPVGNIVFSADATIAQWRAINTSFGKLDCEVFAVPHHGGSISGTQADLDWLMTQAVAARVAVTSVGTANTYSHPQLEVVKAACNSGAKLMCTQMTGQCHADLEAARTLTSAHVIFPGRSSKTKDVTRGGKSRNVACAGTVRARVGPHLIEVDYLREHQACVDSMVGKAGMTPMCR